MLERLKALVLSWRWYALTAGISLAIGFGGCWWLRDQMAAGDQLKEARAETKAAVKVVAQTQKAAEITQDVGTRVEVRRDEVRTVYRTLVEKVPIYVPAEADRQCIVPVGFVRLHDAAAQGAPAAVPDGAGEPADAPSGVPLSTVGETVAFNYGGCAEDRERLKGWQTWYAEQKAGWGRPSP